PHWPEHGDCCDGGSTEGHSRFPHPLRKDNLTLRSGLSTLRSTRAIDCHVPSASRPPTTGTVANGGISAGMTCDRPCPGEPCVCRQRSSAGSRSLRAERRSSSLPAPS